MFRLVDTSKPGILLPVIVVALFFSAVIWPRWFGPLGIEDADQSLLLLKSVDQALPETDKTTSIATRIIEHFRDKINLPLFHLVARPFLALSATHPRAPQWSLPLLVFLLILAFHRLARMQFTDEKMILPALLLLFSTPGFLGLCSSYHPTLGLSLLVVLYQLFLKNRIGMPPILAIAILVFGFLYHPMTPFCLAILTAIDHLGNKKKRLRPILLLSLILISTIWAVVLCKLLPDFAASHRDGPKNWAGPRLGELPTLIQRTFILVTASFFNLAFPCVLGYAMAIIKWFQYVGRKDPVRLFVALPLIPAFLYGFHQVSVLQAFLPLIVLAILDRLPRQCQNGRFLQACIAVSLFQSALIAATEKIPITETLTAKIDQGILAGLQLKPHAAFPLLIEETIEKGRYGDQTVLLDCSKANPISDLLGYAWERNRATRLFKPRWRFLSDTSYNLVRNRPVFVLSDGSSTNDRQQRDGCLAQYAFDCLQFHSRTDFPSSEGFPSMAIVAADSSKRDLQACLKRHRLVEKISSFFKEEDKTTPGPKRLISCLKSDVITRFLLESFRDSPKIEFLDNSRLEFEDQFIPVETYIMIEPNENLGIEQYSSCFRENSDPIVPTPDRSFHSIDPIFNIGIVHTGFMALEHRKNIGLVITGSGGTVGVLFCDIAPEQGKLFKRILTFEAIPKLDFVSEVPLEHARIVNADMLFLLQPLDRLDRESAETCLHRYNIDEKFRLLEPAASFDDAASFRFVQVDLLSGRKIQRQKKQLKSVDER